LKTLFTIIGLACIVSNSVVLYIAFLWAYFYNNYIFIATINDFGEANLEFIILPASIVLGVYAMSNFFKYIQSESKTAEVELSGNP